MLVSNNEQLAGIVLAVDDDDDAHVILNLAFAKAGIAPRLRTLNGGGEAISYLAGEGQFADRAMHPLPNVVLLDLKMPRCLGSTCCSTSAKRRR